MLVTLEMLEVGLYWGDTKMHVIIGHLENSIVVTIGELSSLNVILSSFSVMIIYGVMII